MTNKTEYIGYRITHKTNGRYYIGIVKAYMWNDKCRARTCSHKGDMPALPRGYMGSGHAMREAILEHGEAAFDREILARFDNLQDADAWEKANVVMNDDDPLSYNLQSGGKSGFKVAESTRAKQSEAKKGENSPNYGGGAGKSCFQSGKAHPYFGKFGKDHPRYGKEGLRGEKHPFFGKFGKDAPNYGNRGEKSPLYKPDRPRYPSGRIRPLAKPKPPKSSLI